MTENVVYLLGAGFSAPLGLPVMFDFLEQANNLYQHNKDEYQHFKPVFQSIKQKLAHVARFYDSNLDNIEEVLSILEMERLLGNVAEKDTDEFIRFIKDTINFYSPTFTGLNTVTRKAKGKFHSITEPLQ
jgi:hypothetical protein